MRGSVARAAEWKPAFARAITKPVMIAASPAWNSPYAASAALVAA